MSTTTRPTWADVESFLTKRGLPTGPPDRDESSPPRRRTSWTAADLLAETFAEPRFAVDGLIPEGLAFMCGAPKLGKSWMALGLSIAVAAGGRALSAVQVERGEALYLALEDSPRRLQSRLRMLLAGEQPPAGLHLETEWPRLDEGGTEALDVYLGRHPEARVVLIDVWPRIRPRASKRTDYYADTIIVVKRSRGQADATLHVTGRDVEERELALRFAPEAGTWALLGNAAEYAMGETRREILEAVRAHGALTPKQAAEVSGVSHEAARQTMRRMAQDGQLAGRNGRYSLGTAVTGVTLSPEQDGQSDEVTGVTALLQANGEEIDARDA